MRTRQVCLNGFIFVNLRDDGSAIGPHARLRPANIYRKEERGSVMRGMSGLAPSARVEFAVQPCSRGEISDDHRFRCRKPHARERRLGNGRTAACGRDRR